MMDLLPPDTLKYVLIAGGVAILLWPQLKGMLSKFKVPASTEKVLATLSGDTSGVGFTEAVLALGEVRKRIDKTGSLDEATQKAFVVITENIVAGASK